MLAQNGGKLVVFGLDVRFGDRSQIRHGVLSFTDLTRLNIRPEDAACRIVAFVGAFPDFVQFSSALGVSVGRWVLCCFALENIIIVTHSDNVTGVFEYAIFQNPEAYKQRYCVLRS